MQVIAHRGANREAEENSWEAFNLAISAGADRLEFDVHLSSDNEPVVIHDSSLKRTAGIDQFVGDLSRKDIANLKLPNGERIPFLDEMIDQLLPKVELNIEIKSNHPKIAEIVGKMVVASKSINRIIVSSFVPMHLIHLSKRYPDIQTACLWADEVVWPQISFFSPLVFMTETRSTILHPVVDFVTESLVDQCKARGWKIFPYAPMLGEEQRREELWTHLNTLGIDGLCTNYPRELKKWLDNIERENQSFPKIEAKLADRNII